MGVILPIHKIGDLKNCFNYRKRTLTSILGKVLIIKLKKKLEMEDIEDDFRWGRNTRQDL